MVYAKFTPSLSNVTSSKVTQWDYGRTLRIEGLKLPTAVRIDFGISGSQTTISRIGITKDGVTDAVIPDSLLEQSKNLVAYVYVNDTTEGKTVRTINITVEARAMPEEFDSPESKELFAEAIELINDVAVRAENAESSAKTHADNAKESLEATQKIAKEFNDTATRAMKDVNDAGSSQIQAVNNTKTEAVNAIQSEGAAQVKAIQDEGASQLEQIQVVGENIVNAAAIAEQNAKNVLANAIKGHLKGEIVTADDVSCVEHEMSMKVYGKNRISLLKECDIKDLYYSWLVNPNNETVTLSITDKDTSVDISGIYFGFSKNGKNGDDSGAIWLIQDGRIVRTSYTTDARMFVSIFKAHNEHLSAINTLNERFNIQLEFGETATDYTPYIDPATANVSRCGKNLFDITNFIGKVNTVNGVTAQVMEDGCVHVSGSPIDTSVSTTIDLSHNKDTQKFPKGTYVYSNNAIRANENILCFPQANNPTTGSWLANFLPTGGEISTEFSIRHIVVFIKQGVTGDVSSKFYLQVESGNNATEFEPFKDVSTHTPSSDGTVSGMMSTAPNMTILTDAEGVMVECEYIKDTNKVIQKLADALGVTI